MKHAIRGHRFGLGLWLALAGCVQHNEGIMGTQSIKVDLVTPASPGDPQHRLGEDARLVTFNLTAYDANDNVDPSFERDVQVWVQFLGSKTPSPYPPPGSPLGTPPPPPLATLHMTAGKAMAQTLMLPPVFGQAQLWIDDSQDPEPTYATGTSPTLWFRDPFIADIQTPTSETALTALVDSPLESKQITVNSSRYGAVGRLVVTSVFAQGYTVSDVKCSDANGTPPCAAAPYDHVEVFSFSAPADQHGRVLQQGQLIDGFSGGISEFDGLTEIGFPATTASSNAVMLERLPAPVKFDSTWFGPLNDPQGMINFERNEAAAIEVDNATVCMLDDNYTTFNQWKLDPSGVGGDCSNNHNVINVITAGVIANLDPATLVGKTLPRVVGVLRPVEFSSFDVWIIYPRSAADLTLP